MEGLKLLKGVAFTFLVISSVINLLLFNSIYFTAISALVYSLTSIYLIMEKFMPYKFALVAGLGGAVALTGIVFASPILVSFLTVTVTLFALMIPGDTI